MALTIVGHGSVRGYEGCLQPIDNIGCRMK